VLYNKPFCHETIYLGMNMHGIAKSPSIFHYQGPLLDFNV